MQTISDWQKVIHALAREKGWYDGRPREALESHMLFVGEIAEASKAVRNGEDPYWLKEGKPEGELAELADAVIYILDYCEYRGWDLEHAIARKHAFNRGREYRHGNKRV